MRPVSHGAPRRSRSIGSMTYGALEPAKPPVAVCIARVSGEVTISSTSGINGLRRSCRSATCASPSLVSSGSTMPQLATVRLCAPWPWRTKHTRLLLVSAREGDSIGVYATLGAELAPPLHPHFRCTSRPL